MCGKEMNNLDRRLVKISYGLLQCEFDICSKCSKKLKKFIYFDVQEITKGDVKMNDIKKPQNRTEATNVIYDLVKEFWGDCVSVKISATSMVDLLSKKIFVAEQKRKVRKNDR